MPKEQYLECGKIVETHGVRGMVRLECYADSPKTLADLRRLYYKDNHGTYTEWKVTRASVQKNMVLVAIEGIDTLDMAIPLKGTVVYGDRADFRLRRGDVFIADILNLPVMDAETGERYGVLEEVITSGVQDVYVVREDDGKSFMIPCVPEFIRKIETDGDNAAISVKLIEGMRT